MAARAPFPGAARSRVASHDGFLRHAGFRWLKVALALSGVTTLAYALIDVRPRPNGGSWYGYTLGTVATLLILWLTLLGLRKRAMTPGRWSLKGWTSAHVYLGLSLIVVATLHTGFQFGWNVHTLAFGLMMLVIASGVWGIVAYAFVPPLLSDNRDELTQPQMRDALRAIDRQLNDAAQPLDHADAAIVARSLGQDAFGGGLWRRLSGHDPRCPTEAALAAIRSRGGSGAGDAADPRERVAALLERKAGMLARLRRHLRLKAMLEIWLYVHVPVTFALIAALAAHIVSVFFYW